MVVISIVIGALGRVPKGLERRLVELINRDHPDYSIVEIGQIIKKSPTDLSRLTVTQISEKDTPRTGS